MENPDPLSPLFKRWSAPELPPGQLQHEVWRRIARDEQEAPSWWARVQGWFAQPAFAAAFVACCVLFGLFFAEVRVSRAQHERQVALARQYVLAIDPMSADVSRP
jgi:hypothetical protein